MHFITVNAIQGDEITINAEKISYILKISKSGTTRILFDFEADGEWVHEDIKESVNEIIAMCEYKPT